MGDEADAAEDAYWEALANEELVFGSDYHFGDVVSRKPLGSWADIDLELKPVANWVAPPEAKLTREDVVAFFDVPESVIGPPKPKVDLQAMYDSIVRPVVEATEKMIGILNTSIPPKARVESPIKMMRLAKELSEKQPIGIIPDFTYSGALGTDQIIVGDLRHGFRSGDPNKFAVIKFGDNVDPNKGKSMANIKQQLLDQVERDRLMLQSLERFPEVDDFEAGTIIGFNRSLATRANPRGTEYLYAAIKGSNGLWFTTGADFPRGASWDEFTKWLAIDSECTGFAVVTEMESLLVDTADEEGEGEAK